VVTGTEMYLHAASDKIPTLSALERRTAQRHRYSLRAYINDDA
jgi:hypothetical protein